MYYHDLVDKMCLYLKIKLPVYTLGIFPIFHEDVIPALDTFAINVIMMHSKFFSTVLLVATLV